MEESLEALILEREKMLQKFLTTKRLFLNNLEDYLSEDKKKEVKESIRMYEKVLESSKNKDN
jgi:hypothetical protein